MALRITYSDKVSFQQLLEKDNSISIYHMELQTLTTEMLKVSYNLLTKIVKEIFNERIVPYNLCSNNSFASRQVNIVYQGTELLSFLGSKILEVVSLEIKESENMNIFKNRVKM